MPWKASDKLPPSAEKLKGHARDIFVAAANAALKQYNNDEGRAIATGMAAVKRYKEKNVKKAMLDKNKLIEAFSDFIEKWFGDKSVDQKMEEEGAKSLEFSVEIKKAVDEEQRTAMFVVLAPDEVDLHGDVYSAEEVEKACHSFSLHCNKANLFHRVETEHANIVQNFITPSDFTLDDGRMIKKGSWLQVWYFPQTEMGEEIWKAVKDGTVDGVSIGATARVEELT